MDRLRTVRAECLQDTGLSCRNSEECRDRVFVSSLGPEPLNARGTMRELRGGNGLESLKEAGRGGAARACEYMRGVNVLREAELVHLMLALAISTLREWLVSNDGRLVLVERHLLRA